jgi:hypothetical protein
MKLFSNEEIIIKTDSSLKPGIRYEQILFHHLATEGYRYLKSKNEFARDFQYGKQIIRIFYSAQQSYIYNVEYSARIIFHDLEKAFKKVYPHYGWTNWTIHLNLHHETENWLCDKETGEYTDESLNKVSNEFIKKIKPQIDTLFNEIDNYPKLNSVYNLRPLKFFDYLPIARLEKRIINGLILVRSFAPAIYDEIKNEYLNLLEKYKGDDATELEAEILTGLEYLEKNDLRLTL